MVFHNLILDIFFNIILLDILIKFIIIFKIVYKKLFYKSKDIFQYKINNFYLTKLFIFVYISFFIIFSYLLKIFNIGKTINLIEVKINIIILFKNIIKTNFLLIFILTTLIAILFILFILLLKFFTKELFKLHFYYNTPIYALRLFVTEQKVITFCKKKYINFLRTLEEVNNLDIFSYILFIIVRNMTIRIHGPLYNIDTKQVLNLGKYHPYEITNKVVHKKITKIIIKYSPFIIIFYDCIFNDFIITHVYYYLLIYTPIMLLKKITECLTNYSKYLGETFWAIYYDKKYPIYAISKKHLPLLEAYAKSGLSTTPFIKDINDVFIEEKNEMFLLNVTLFYLYNEERHTYMNSLGNYIQINSEGKAFEELEDENKMEDYIYLGEEWIILTDNRNKNNENNSLN